MDDILSGLKQSLLRIKDPAILIGALYLCSFLFLWPFWIKYHRGPISSYHLVLLSVVAVVLVHILLNWVYILTVAVPAVMAAILFGIGAAIWILSPACFGLMSGIWAPFEASLPFLSGFGSNIISGIGETVSRTGQFMMVIAGGLWWFVQKARDIKQSALVFYLIGLASFGFLSSVVSVEALFAFLFFWMVVDAKLRGVEAPTAGTIFRVLATIAVIFKVPFLPVNYSGVLGSLVSGYKICLTGGLLAIIWRADRVINLLPEQVKKYGAYIVLAAERVIRIYGQGGEKV